MELSKTLTAICSAGALAFCLTAPVATADEHEESPISASVAVASSYLWRGFDLGSGTPAVSGDIGVSAAGFHGTVWVSSGDTDAGTEYDLIVGYGGEVGDFSYDISLINYIYPTGQYKDFDGSIGDFMEIVGTVGFGPVSFSYYDNIAGDTGGYAASEDYTYMTLGAEFGGFGALLGKHDEGIGDATHLDLSYAYNDNLAFTISKVINSDLSDENELTFVVSYSLPLM